MSKYTEAKAKANKKWNQNNKERVQYINKRSATKSFILNLATEEDLKNIESYIIERKAKLKQSKLAERFKDFDYEAYWKKWIEEHPGQSKEIDWGEPVGREFKW